MNNDVLKNVDIVLFFKEIYEYNTLNIANALREKLSNIGEPNILNAPEHLPLKIKSDLKKIDFFENEDFKLASSMSKISCSINITDKNNFDAIKNNVKNICDVLQDYKIKVKSIGVVNNFLYNIVNLENVKKVFLKDKEVNDSDLFTLSWYKKIEEKNIWKHIKTIQFEEKIQMQFTVDINNIDFNEELNKNQIINFLEDSLKQSNEMKKELELKMGVD